MSECSKSKMAPQLSVLLVLLVYCVSVYGHVALTYPPARRYDLDFLDNSRTKPPCGMPKGNFGLLLAFRCDFINTLF